jgi:tRNA (mo5U34)-methyltransferase
VSTPTPASGPLPPPAGRPGASASDLQEEVNKLLWYHTIDVAPGVATKGMFDNRHALSLVPWPDLAGKRCLDIGTWDGLYAWEMERRGASEVVALDVPDLSDIDYPPEVRHDPTFDLSQSKEQPRPAGFELLHEIFDSKVKWRAGNIYDVNPAELGTFDVVIIGSLLVHLRDPVRALDAVRSVVDGHLLVADFIDTAVNIQSLRRPIFKLRGEGSDFQWWLASEAGLRQLLHVGGFTIEEVSPYFLLRFGPALGADHKPRLHGVKGWARAATDYALTRDRAGGHLHRAYRCRRRF